MISNKIVISNKIMIGDNNDDNKTFVTIYIVFSLSLLMYYCLLL